MWLILAVLLALSASALQAAAVVAATLVSSGVVWLLARRKESGSVERSDAGTVFDAYDRAFERVEREVLRLTQANDKLRERVAVVEAENQELRPYKDRVAALETEVERLRGIVNGH